MADERDERDERDEIIARVAEELQHLPTVDPAAKARVLVAVAGERAGGIRSREVRSIAQMARWRTPLLGALAAVVVAAVWIGSARRRNAGDTSTAAPAMRAQSPVAALAAAKGEDAVTSPVPVQLVFREPMARRVAVVGDFTDWDARRVPLDRDPASGLWSVTLGVRPGRHVYAFVVDDTLWVRDPRAPVAPDADFGRPGSLLLVGGGRP